MLNDEATRAVALTAIAQPTSPAPAFGDLGAWLLWHADTAAATVAVHLAERALRPRVHKPNRRPGARAVILLAVAAIGKAGRR
jgi:hypothetical protein